MPWPAVGQASEPSKLDIIELGVGYGFGFPPDSAFLFADPEEGIPRGLDLDELVRRVLIQRALHERLYLEIDYDAKRNVGLNLLGGNTYSLRYQGLEGEFLQELSVGNRYLSIPGSRRIPIDEGSPDSFAFRARAGKGRLGLDALLRYGASREGRKRFRGGRRVVETRLLDVAYLKGRFFLLPDAGIDEASLRVYRSTRTAPDLAIDGKPFRLLLRSSEYEYDNAGGRLTLQHALAGGEELAVRYAKGGMSVGHASLGLSAIFAEDGTRDDFNANDYPQYFDAGKSFLYLKKQGFNSYWELRNAYPLEDLFSGELATAITVSLRFTQSGALNENYQGLLEKVSVDPAQAVMFFDLRDASGLIPRPFPGARPFDPLAAPYPSGDPKNPFDPTNPIYGGVGYPTEQDSINTLLIRYTVGAGGFFLDHDLIEGSVRVTVDGQPLDVSRYSVDCVTGLIEFDPYAIGPGSEVVVSYRYAAAEAGRGDLFAALGASYEAGAFHLRNLAAYTLPIQGASAPLIGEEQPTELRDSLEVSWSAGPPEGAAGLLAAAKAGGALSLARANSKGEAIVADMESAGGYAVSVREEAWMLGSRSTVLPNLGSPVELTTRGELRYENYWESRLIGGDILRTLAWDNSSNPQFSYGQKAGPYNSADQTEGGEDRSLVLDFSIPPGASDGYVSAATALPRTNLKGYPQLFLLLRGTGISGGAVRLYVELLQAYDEDLNGNGLLDGEATSAQPGFTITPVGPVNERATVIGSDRFGKSNDRLDSEDLDDSGALDSPAVEVGALLAEVLIDSSDWKRVSLDLKPLLQPGSPALAAFQAAKALRLTVKPVSPAPPVEVSGRLLVNAIRFSGTGLDNLESSAPDLLGLREAGVSENAQVGASAFSKSFPDIYDELHGNAAYRERNGQVERTLVCRFTPMLPQGEAVWVSRRFAPAADFSDYREFCLYVFLPPGKSFPAASRPALEFLAGSQDKYALRFQPDAFASGWNEVRVSLEAPYTVRVRGASAGALEKTGALEVWRAVSQVRFGLIAETGPLDADFEFWLDEWHLRDCRWSLAAAAFAEGRAGYRGTLLALGSLPLLSDLYLVGAYEWAERGFTETPDRRRRRYSAVLEARLLRVLPAEIRWGGTVENRARPAASDPPAFPGGFTEGERIGSYAHTIGLDAGLSYLPVLRHSYQRSFDQTDAVGLTETQYLFQRSRIVSESLGLSAQYRFPANLSQTYAYARTWRCEEESAGSAGSASALPTDQSQSLDQRYEGQVELKWPGGLLQARALREEVLASDVCAPPLDLPASYARRLAVLFSPVEAALPGARRSSRMDRLNLSLAQGRSRFWGARLALEAGYHELNADPAAGVRDAALSSSLSLALPFSPDGRGILELTPSASRSFRASCRRAEWELGEAEILGAGLLSLVRPPLYFLNPWLDLGRLHELEAVEALAGDPRVLGGSSGAFKSSLGLEGALKTSPWYLPSRGGAAVSSDTSREGGAYAQKRSLRFTAGKDFALGPQQAGDRFSCDLSWESSWDYARRLRASIVESRSRLRLLQRLRGDLAADHTLSWTRQRQRAGDEGLVMFPEDPSRQPVVPELPGIDSVYSLLSMQYRWERPVRPNLRTLHAVLRGSEKPPPVVHEENVWVENQIVVTDRARTSLTGSVPLRLSLTHKSRLTVQEGVQLEMDVKAFGGVQERIENGRSLYRPSLGFELRLGATLTF